MLLPARTARNWWKCLIYAAVRTSRRAGRPRACAAAREASPGSHPERSRCRTRRAASARRPRVRRRLLTAPSWHDLGSAGRIEQLAVMPVVVLRHPLCGEALLETRPNGATIYLAQSLQGFDRGLLAIDDESGHPVFYDFGHGAGSVGNHGRSARHGFDH